MKKFVHFMMVPFTGLGLYNGFRGNRWLKNRIKVFEQYVIPSLINQKNKDFIVWIAWRPEEKSNRLVVDLQKRLLVLKNLKFVHTFSGCPIFDDKYDDTTAKTRLVEALHGAMGELMNTMGECEEVLMTIQPSDDLYSEKFVEGIQKVFNEVPAIQALGFEKGYMMNYATKELAEYNPTTNPPFYTIKFPRSVFIDPIEHADYTALKLDIGKYKKGTPLPSHEYVKDCLNYAQIKDRGFIVGCHGENISTVFNHPFKGKTIEGLEKSMVLDQFGILLIPRLQIQYSLRKRLLRLLPFKAQRKIRYVFGERLWNRLYNFLRS